MYTHAGRPKPRSSSSEGESVSHPFLLNLCSEPISWAYAGWSRVQGKSCREAVLVWSRVQRKFDWSGAEYNRNFAGVEYNEACAPTGNFVALR